MGLFPPPALERLQRLDAVGRVVVHPLEDYQAILGRPDLGLVDLEPVSLAQAVFVHLGFDQRLGRLRQIRLHLTDADGPQIFAA